MNQVVVFTYDCQHCDGEATDGGTLHLGVDGRLALDLEMCASQLTFTCQECGHRYVTGDIEIYDEDDL